LPHRVAPRLCQRAGGNMDVGALLQQFDDAFQAAFDRNQRASIQD
jgi:hypothetical protein